MAKHKMVQYNLFRNAVAAYFAAIEIHNKPNISYRYETVSLLILNAWELLLKAFIKKYIRKRSIFENNNYTISFEKSLIYVDDYINVKKPKTFTAIKANLLKIEEYRNKIAHFYNESLDPYIFMLIARSSLSFTDFIKEYFSKDIIGDESLFIMPLGFKLPFNPEDFLSQKAVNYISSEESKMFIKSIIKNINDLKEQGIEDSIVVGFSIYLESVKKTRNSDLLVAITDKDEADISITTPKKVILTNDPNAQKVYLSEEKILEKYPLTYRELCERCKEEIPGFTQNKKFHNKKNGLRDNPNFTYTRILYPSNAKSAISYYYSEDIIPEIRKALEEDL